MLSYDRVLARLRTAARPDKIAGMARYGLGGENRLGVAMPVLRALGKEIGRDHALALRLWEAEIQEARILASLVAEPGELTEEQMEAWVLDFDSWDVCDQVCMNLFEKSPQALRKIAEWSQRKETFVKRASFALIACLAWHDKAAPDSLFLEFLPLIRREACDERNYVKKAVSWALRNIGKRNPALNRAALEAAGEIRRLNSKAARWIAADATRELASEAVHKRLRKKAAAG